MNHQMNTRDASRDWNAEHVYKDRPACARPGSELTEPDAPIALTVDGYKSVLVAVINKHAFLRISPDGFRLITLNKSKDAYCIQGAPGAGWLQSHGTVQGLVHTLSSSADLMSVMPPKVTPEAILKAAQRVPGAGLAWATVNDNQYKADWLPDETKQALLNSRGY